MLGPGFYVAAVVVGGWLWTGYTHYSETVSTLTSRGAPNQAIVVPLFTAYNLCLIAFAYGLHRGIRPRRYGSLGPAFLMLAGLDGLILFLFPQEPWGASQLTTSGTGHVVLAGIGAICFLLAAGLLWRRLREDPSWAPFDRFTLTILGSAIVLGAFGAGSVTTSYAGFAERLSIGTFLLWTEVLAVGLFRRRASSHPSTAPGRPAGSTPS